MQYKIYRKDRKELIDKNDGGVLIMVRPDIKSDESSELDTEYEIKWIEIIPNDKDQILIGSFYRPPNSDEKAIQELEKSLSKIKSDKRYRNAKIFFGGDFNLGDINWATGGTISGGRNISGGW
jgi:exonuclease III